MRYATIGTNFIVDRLLSAVRDVPGCTHAAVYSRTLARAKAYAKKTGAQTLYTSLDALCADPRIDAVYIASPNALHAPQAEKLLRAGKHVLCEKPITLDAPTFSRLLDIAAENGVAYMEAMRPTHSPGIEVVISLLLRIGQPRRATITFCKYSSRYDAFREGIIENAFDPTLGNGALMDIGVYCVHVMHALFGMPMRIQGSAVFLRGGIDGAGTLLCDYSGMTCELLYSKIADDALPSMIQGEEGSLLFEGITAIQSVTFAPRQGEKAVFFTHALEEDMRYEWLRFMLLAEQGGDIRNTPEAKASLEAMTILDKARACLGIDFCKK